MTDVRVPLGERLTPLGEDPVPLAERVFDLVGDAIVAGVLSPREKLNDKVLAAALGVSRTPVREALQRLTWIGLVEMSPSRYTRVTAVTPEAVRSTLEYVGLQSAVALRLAMERMDADALAAAVAMLDTMISASEADDSAALMVASQAFVALLVAHTGNPVFQRVMKEVSLLVARNLRHLRQLPDSAQPRTEAFRRMREAMLAGDVDAAERAFREQHGVGVDTSL
ncbi:GntR family transcriptional regulator [Streptomyces sp. AC495_CC817]|uniref:GntR family transcriptional regulator n=1 Tax=Streptomyces sp. AC495_CC817 TaxID=2823900 RepID=UPI001C258BCF|nr:GntR family transcriptional regulator [Streptomyces sp. AC495_CC817]